MKSKSLKALNNYKFYIIAGPLFKVIEVIFELCIPFIVKDIINYGIENNDTFFIITRCILMISLGILGFCSTLICQYLASIASQGYGTKLRDEIFIQSNKLDLSSINRFSKGYIQ
ncbi:MAG: ABC transporter ATP-binding protein, partial [Firmicutes bacterium]|nr:ABC transporter ATP-binding protein [Candidatus Alectryobacillus merdavium]